VFGFRTELYRLYINQCYTSNIIASFLDNDQLDTRLLYFTIRLLLSSTCFEHCMLIIRRLNCIDAASGIVTLSKWPMHVQQNIKKKIKASVISEQ